jgi:hypothetical protein
MICICSWGVTRRVGAVAVIIRRSICLVYVRRGEGVHEKGRDMKIDDFCLLLKREMKEDYDYV